MKYKAKTISLSTLAVTPAGIVTGKCDTCRSLDCSNSVERQTISLFGVNQKMRCLVTSHGEPSLVVECEGYTDK